MKNFANKKVNVYFIPERVDCNRCSLRWQLCNVQLECGGNCSKYIENTNPEKQAPCYTKHHIS